MWRSSDENLLGPAAILDFYGCQTFAPGEATPEIEEVADTNISVRKLYVKGNGLKL
ncbi:hypothetical protein [Paenibacillus medicaginis]|uniref:Uncharacterized protein n=1 Tax=Paenibacillus medicaginis TaxID=1470560 RepID=A0ABV5C819_9BACL